MNETRDQLLRMQDLNDQSHSHTKRVLNQISKISEKQMSINEQVVANLREVLNELQKVLSSTSPNHSAERKMEGRKHNLSIKTLVLSSGVILGIWVGASFEVLHALINTCAR